MSSLAICQGFWENLPTSQEVTEIASKFAGVERLKEAIEQLQLLLSKIWVKTPSFYDGFKLQWKKR
jgi:hypothetical protein